MSNGVIPLKRPYIPSNIAPRGSECENNLQEVMAWESFHMLNLTFDPFFKVSFIYKDIVIKFAGNVYGYENLSLQNFGLILKNKIAAITNC